MAKWDQIGKSIPIVAQAKKPQAISDSLLPRLMQNAHVYEPHEMYSLSRRRYAATEQKMRRMNAQTGRSDAFAQLHANPLQLWKSPESLSQYITSNGRIVPGYVNGHLGGTQKKLAKAIRRCRAAGLLSTVHRSVFET